MALVQLGVIVVLVMMLTKSGRATLRRMWQSKYKETDADAALKRAVLTFAERTAASQQPDRADIPAMKRHIRNFIVALVPLHNLTEAKQEYFFEVGFNHTVQHLKDSDDAGNNQRGQVRQMRR
jgi:hypothetical protein